MNVHIETVLNSQPKKSQKYIYATITSWINVALLLSFFVQGLFWNYFFVAFSSFLPNVPDSRAGELWQKVANRGKIRWRHTERVGQIEFYLQNKALPKCSALGNFNRSQYRALVRGVLRELFSYIRNIKNRSQGWF